jgi:hypothetical protein
MESQCITTFYVLFYLLTSPKRAKILTANGTFHAKMFNVTNVYKNYFNVGSLNPTYEHYILMVKSDSKYRINMK